jgi:hypothetical protein
VVTAYNSAGLQSLPSNEVSLTVSNLPPSVSLTSPQSNASFTPNSSIGLTATATDPDGSITKVEFYQDNNKVGESTSAPYSATWSNVPSGNFTLTALAYDDAGAAVRSTGVAIAVAGATPGPSPTPGSTDKVRVISLTPIVKAGDVAKFKMVASEMNPTQDTVVNYSLSGTATGGLNYSMTGMTGQATIRSGKRSVLVPMQTLTLPSPTGGKTAIVTLLPGTGYVPGRANAVVKIVNH